MNSYEIDQLEARVRSHVERNEMYTRERMEAFGMKWQLWLIEAIRNALLRINGIVDEGLVETLKNRLLRKDMP